MKDDQAFVSKTRQIMSSHVVYFITNSEMCIPVQPTSNLHEHLLTVYTTTFSQFQRYWHCVCTHFI